MFSEHRTKFSSPPENTLGSSFQGEELVTSTFISFIDKGEMVDITFQIDKENVTAHGKLVYLEAAPEFRNPYKDGIVQVNPRISKEAFIEFLKYLLSGRVNKTSNNIWDLLLSFKGDIRRVIQMRWKFIIMHIY